jgi:abequosyltransferase
MLKTPILSIVVPTYNRSELLNLLLNSLFRDLESLEAQDEIEIIVIDNSSTDNTVERLRMRIEDGQKIKLYVNEKNIGMDANLAYCFDVSKGKYFWQIGDDELLHRGALIWVLNFCKNYDFGLLHLESVGFPKNQYSIQNNISVPKVISPIKMGSEEIFRMANIFLTFISANIINKHKLLELNPFFNSKSETNTFLPQLNWIYGALKLNLDNYYVKNVMFGALSNNTGGYKLVKVFGENLIEITERFFKDNNSNFKSIMTNAVLTRLFPSEIYAQSKLNKSNFEFEEMENSLKILFSKNLYFHIFLKNLFKPSGLKTKIQITLVIIFNKINRAINYKLL